MWWLDNIVVPALLVLAIGGFVMTVRWRARDMTRTTTRTAESMYPLYADSTRKQRKHAEEQGGQWRDDEGRQDALAPRPVPPRKTATGPGSDQPDGQRPTRAGG